MGQREDSLVRLSALLRDRDDACIAALDRVQRDGAPALLSFNGRRLNRRSRHSAAVAQLGRQVAGYRRVCGTALRQISSVLLCDDGRPRNEGEKEAGDAHGWSSPGPERDPSTNTCPMWRPSPFPAAQRPCVEAITQLNPGPERPRTADSPAADARPWQ